MYSKFIIIIGENSNLIIDFSLYNHHRFNHFMVISKNGNILVPFDNSKNSIRALNKAITFANLVNAKITLVHVINYHKAMAKIVAPYKGTLIDHIRKFMTRAERSASNQDVEMDEKILYGNVAEEIFNFMNKRKFDLVVVGRQGTSNLTGPTLGSVSNALVQRSKIPVLVVT